MGLESRLKVCSGLGGGTGAPPVTLCAPPGGGNGLECRLLGLEGKTTIANGSSSPLGGLFGLVLGAGGAVVLEVLVPLTPGVEVV